MAEDFYDIPMETDPDSIFQDMVVRIRQTWPDWEPNFGNLDTVLLVALSFAISELASLAGTVPAGILRTVGRSLFSISPQEAVAATVDSTWEASDNKGYKIEEGTKVVMAVSGNENAGFEVAEDVEIPEGSTKTEAGEVPLRAIIPGTLANGLEGEAQPADALAWIKAITIVGATAGGEDAETEAEYTSRLRLDLQLLSPRVITAVNFEIAALQTAGVARALSRDGYDAETEEDEQERTVSTAVVDSEGEPVSVEIKALVQAYLEARRELNFVVQVVDPDYTEVDASVEAHPLEGYTDAEVKANIEAKLEDVLSPAKWGLPTFGDPGSSGGWRYEPKLRFFDLVEAIQEAEGVDYIENPKAAKTGNPLEAKDLTLDGAFPLTRPGVLTVTAI